MKRICILVLTLCFALALSACGTTAADPSQEASGDAGSSQEQSVTTNPPEATSKSETTGQKNALASAKNYLSMMAFSYSGLVKQLEYDKYSHEDAVYAADNCGADWNEQASKAAKNYLSMMSFSREGLIEQLQYDGYTGEQAAYGATENGY